jgi:hypothetical protein
LPAALDAARLPGPEAYLDWARHAATQHDDWDDLHTFAVLQMDGEDRLCLRMLACLDPELPGELFPAAVAGIARRLFVEHAGDEDFQPAGVMLSFEAWTAELPEDASEEDKRRLNADWVSHNMANRPDRLEVLQVWAADPHGGMWQVVKIRGREGLAEKYHKPGSDPGQEAPAALQAIAKAMGVAWWNIWPAGRHNN